MKDIFFHKETYSLFLGTPRYESNKDELHENEFEEILENKWIQNDNNEHLRDPQPILSFFNNLINHDEGAVEKLSDPKPANPIRWIKRKLTSRRRASSSSIPWFSGKSSDPKPGNPFRWIKRKVTSRRRASSSSIPWFSEGNKGK